MRYFRRTIIAILAIVLLRGAVPTAFAGETEAYQHLAERMDLYFTGEEPRLIESYAEPYPPGPDGTLRWVAFTYDNALAAIMLLHRGTADDVRRARLICDALAWHQDHDPLRDGRLRQAYYADQNLAALSQSRVANGFYNTFTGEQAWAGLAWLTCFERTGEAAYLNAAERTAQFIVDRLRDTSEPGFYIGFVPQFVPVKSTEHNLDLYVFFSRLATLTGDAGWASYAEEARRMVEEIAWDGSGGKFWAGTTDDAETDNQYNLTGDQQAWAVLALGPTRRSSRALGWMNRTLRVSSDGFTGYDYGINVNPDDPGYAPAPDGVWFEGTAQMASAFQVSGHYGRADHSAWYLSELDRAQATALHTNGRGLTAASRDGVTTGYPLFLYYASPHVGATAWYLAATRRYNPFWNISTDALIPGTKLHRDRHSAHRGEAPSRPTGLFDLTRQDKM